MPAYLITDEDFFGGVYFGKTRREAVKKFESEIGDHSVGVTRAPFLDVYEESGQVPMQDMMYHGFLSSCYACDADLNIDNDDVDVSEVVGFFDGPVFCNEACQERWREERWKKDEAEMQAKAKLIEKAHELVFHMDFTENSFYAYTKIENGEAVVREARLRFTIPGCKFWGIQVDLDNNISYAQGDEEVVKPILDRKKILDSKQRRQT